MPRKLLRVSATQDSSANAKSAEEQVKEKVDEALQHVQDTHDQIKSSAQESEQEDEERLKGRKFRRAKNAMKLKEQGHHIEPSAGNSTEEGSSINENQAARTRENAAKDEAQVPDGTIHQSVCQRLMALEELAASRPRIKLVSRGEPIPQLRHHYAAAAWWAVA